MIDAKFQPLIDWLIANRRLHADSIDEHLFPNELLQDAYLNGVVGVQFWKGRAIYTLTGIAWVNNKP